MKLNDLIKELKYWQNDYGDSQIIFIYLDKETKASELKIHHPMGDTSQIEIKPL